MCTALLVDRNGRVIAASSREIPQIFPQPGWVEQDPLEIFRTAVETAGEVLQKQGIAAGQVKGLGITNQRETTVVWEKQSGQPVYNAIVWQCRRTAAICEDLKKRGLAGLIQSKSGLVIDAYFSATKIRWILDHIRDGQKRAEAGELLFGTVDSWLIWKLSGGRLHVTDYSNASRTLLFNIHTRQWDPELLEMLNIPPALLPEAGDSSRIFGETLAGLPAEQPLPIAAAVGDQQSALFGQACYEGGQAKNTYGTGCFVLMNSGNQAVKSEYGLISTIAWGVPGRLSYALEGSIFVTGSAVQWLRDNLKIIDNSAQSEAMALAVPDNGGVYFVPAFTGLGAPHWDMFARGTLLGLTRGSSREHIVRATLEAIAYQVRDVIDTMQKETGLHIPLLRVDGGGAANRFLLQFQADILNIPLEVAAVTETTALGAAYLAGLATGLWQDQAELARKWQPARIYRPLMSQDKRETLYRRWQKAIAHARDWAGSA
jgi:glycerol kinase